MPERLDGLVLTLEGKPPRLAETLAQILAAVDSLTPNGGPGFLILEAEGEDFAQVAGGDGAYTAEWREHGRGTFKHWVAGRAGQPSSRDISIPTNGAEVIVKQNERLDAADVKAILTAFAEQGGRPAHFAWRDMTQEFLPEPEESTEETLKHTIGRTSSAPSEDDASESAALSLPFPTVVVAGDHALAERLRLRTAGVTPLVMGDREDVEWLEYSVAIDEGVIAATLKAADDLNIADWIAAKLLEFADDFPLPTSTWPEDDVLPQSLCVHLDSKGQEAKPAVIIGMVPTPNAWQTPAHAQFGDWNDCPPPNVHVAIHRYWHDRYGSEIVSMSHDVVECTVERPPATREEALALATEQYAYCSDIVDQGVQSIERLAAMLMKSEVWFFWWD